MSYLTCFRSQKGLSCFVYKYSGILRYNGKITISLIKKKIQHNEVLPLIFETEINTIWFPLKFLSAFYHTYHVCCNVYLDSAINDQIEYYDIKYI